MSYRTPLMIVLLGLLAGMLLPACAALPPERLTWAERDLIREGGPDEPMKLVVNSNREGNAQLRRPSLEVEMADPDVTLLVSRMMATVKQADGVGIAAPQVGINRRLIVVQRYDLVPDHPFVAYFNPEITRFSRTKVTDWEGCLSVPAGCAQVERSSAIHVAYDEGGGRRAGRRVSGFTSRIFQHEIDHLDGVLFTDRIGSATLVSREELEEVKTRMREQAKKEALEEAEKAKRAEEASRAKRLDAPKQPE